MRNREIPPWLCKVAIARVQDSPLYYASELCELPRAHQVRYECGVIVPNAEHGGVPKEKTFLIWDECRSCRRVGAASVTRECDTMAASCNAESGLLAISDRANSLMS